MLLEQKGICREVPAGTFLHAPSFSIDVFLRQKYNNSNFDEKKAIQDEYKQKIIDVCFDENGKLNPQIKDFLDSQL